MSAVPYPAPAEPADHPIKLDDLLADAATELRDDGMIALGAAVEVARVRLRAAMQALEQIANAPEAGSLLAYPDFAKEMLRNIQRAPLPRTLRDASEFMTLTAR